MEIIRAHGLPQFSAEKKLPDGSITSHVIAVVPNVDFAANIQCLIEQLQSQGDRPVMCYPNELGLWQQVEVLGVGDLGNINGKHEVVIDVRLLST